MLNSQENIFITLQNWRKIWIELVKVAWGNGNKMSGFRDKLCCIT